MLKITKPPERRCQNAPGCFLGGEDTPAKIFLFYCLPLLLLLNTIKSNSFWKRSVMEGKVLAEKVEFGGLPHPAGSIRSIWPGQNPAGSCSPAPVILTGPLGHSFVAISGSPKCGSLSSLWTSAQEPVGSPDSKSRRAELTG